MCPIQERRLATIRKIQEVKPITGADKICAYRVDGWWVVDQVGKYTVGALVVYLEVDSWVSRVAPTKQNFPHGTTGYDIQTTTHNYFCGGILVHNCSATFYLDPTGDFHVCSRNLDLAPDENNLYWKIAIKNDIENKMRNLGLLGHAIQGEIIGEGIQGNQYKRKPVLHLFDVFSVPLGNYISLAGVHQVAAQLDIKTVPVVERDFPLQHFTIEELLKYAEGESQLNNSQREGLVFQCLNHPEKSFKVISNAWLLGNE